MYKKPEGLTDEHLDYLDELRESGFTNIFGARPFLQEDFDLDRDTARAILTYWMNTFGERHPKNETNHND
jgi:hypothetical protein